MPAQPSSPLTPKAVSLRYAALSLAFSMLLSGCQSLDQGSESSNPSDLDLNTPIAQTPLWSNQSVAVEPKDIWERLRAGYRLQDSISANPRIEQQRLWFASNPRSVASSSERSAPYIHYIVERLEERKMPTELALLPMLESAYNPLAYSSANAAGLWQIIPSTGRNFKLRQTHWYDGRRDITASTQAAMDYLDKLHAMFDGDWLLALAAYNAGEGRIMRAIERNQQLGLPTDYWNLSLPTETQNYVPKLLALSQVIMSPDAYGVTLSPIANQPYFDTVELKQRLNLAHVAQLAEVDEQELYLLNPAFKQRITIDGPQHLLVPVEKVERLTSSLLNIAPQDTAQEQAYLVRAGNNLHDIAERYKLSVASIKELNQLTGNSLRVGQQLNLYRPALEPSAQERPTRRASSHSYRVRQGDNLWSIAKAHQVSVKDIQRWNALPGKALKVGQRLNLYSSHNQGQAKQRQGTVTYYKVRKGDSLYLIAKRFKVQMKKLQSWNPSSDKALKPGQVLTLHLPD